MSAKPGSGTPLLLRQDNLPDGLHLRNTYYGPTGVNSYVRVHIVRIDTQRSLCGKDARKWGSRHASHFDDRDDCKLCAKKYAALAARSLGKESR